MPIRRGVPNLRPVGKGMNSMTIGDTIDSYRKRRRQMLPLIIGAAAVLLVVVGIIIVVVSLSGGGGIRLFATKTPTPTITPSPTITPLPTEIPTETATPTITLTATASAPYPYLVKEGDTLTDIITAEGLGDNPNAIVLIYLLNPYNPTNTANPGINPQTGAIFVGQTITLPPANFPFPTTTPLPTGLAPSSRISYFVMPGDSLGAIAAKFNSTVDAIVQANSNLLTDGASSIIYPGWTLLVPINIVTPVPTATLAVTPTATP
jgi:LysM repeat protein